MRATPARHARLSAIGSADAWRMSRAVHNHTAFGYADAPAIRAMRLETTSDGDYTPVRIFLTARGFHQRPAREDGPSREPV